MSRRHDAADMFSKKILSLALFLLYALNCRYTIDDAFSCTSDEFPDDCCCEVYSGVICLQFAPGSSRDCYSIYEEEMIAREKVKILMDIFIGLIFLRLIWEIHVFFGGGLQTGQDSTSTRANRGSTQISSEGRAELILQNIVQSKVPVIFRSTDLNFSHEKTSLLHSIPNQDATITNSDTEKGYEYGVCPICLDDFVEGNDIAFSKGKCKHVFHLHCLQHWLMQSDECPMCRVNYFQK